MERLELISLSSKLMESGRYLFDCHENDDKTIIISSNTQVDLIIVNIDENVSFKIDLEENAIANIAILAKNGINGINLESHLSTNSSIDMYYADFSSGKGNARVSIYLDKEGAKANWHLASLSSGNDNKEFDVSIYHNQPNTFALSDNYGVCKDNAKLVFSGTSKIIKGSIKANTRQNARIMVFDEKSIADVRPILKIDENDVSASHGAVVGKISDEHLFYLTSRGLSELEAKELITYGYLKPISVGFNEERYQNDITDLIERKM